MRERSLQDIDNDIATIWKEIKEFDETTPENIELERNKIENKENSWIRSQSVEAESRTPKDR